MAWPGFQKFPRRDRAGAAASENKKRRLHWRAFTAAAALTVAHAAVQNQTDTFSPIVLNGNLPYQISLRVLDVGGTADIPTLQSFAAGSVDGEWVLVAGRTNGLHNFTSDGFLNFPPAYQNTFIWVIDPVGKQTWSRSLNDPSSGLTVAQVDSLSATNTESAQRNDVLYIAGGYVYDRTADDFTTYDTLTALDLPGVVDWVKNGTGMLTDHFRQISDPLIKVAGGVMHFVDGRALLVFGQDFEGPYLPSSNGDYTMQVRAFDIVDDGMTLAIANVVSSTPAPEYRRRDLNVVPMLSGGGSTQGLIALSGVFLPGADGGAWTVPVEIDAAGTPSMADPSAPGTFKQGMNSYSSATISLYSPTLDETHTISLGGISLNYFDTTAGGIVYDENIPFINGITSIIRSAAGEYGQFYMGEYPSVPNPSNGNAPFLFGAEAEFFPADGIAEFSNGMLDLDSLTATTVVGYIYGGIIAQQPNFGSTGASNIIFEVVYTPVYPASFNVAGKNHRTTRARSFVLRGSAAQSTNIVQWRVLGRGTPYRNLAVNGDGSWHLRVRNLRVGKNRVRLRGVNLNGFASSTRTITIVRR